MEAQVKEVVEVEGHEVGAKMTRSPDSCCAQNVVIPQPM